MVEIGGGGRRLAGVKGAIVTIIATTRLPSYAKLGRTR